MKGVGVASLLLLLLLHNINVCCYKVCMAILAIRFVHLEVVKPNMHEKERIGQPSYVMYVCSTTFKLMNPMVYNSFAHNVSVHLKCNLPIAAAEYCLAVKTV